MWKNQPTKNRDDFQPIPNDNADPATPQCTSEDHNKHSNYLGLECQAMRMENMLFKEKINRMGLGSAVYASFN